MKTETEIRAALSDLLFSFQRGFVPPECMELTKGEISALFFVLGEEQPGDNLSWMLDEIRKWRVKLRVT